MAGKVLVVTADVMFWARIRGEAAAAGVAVARIDDDAAMEAAYREGGVAKVFADLGSRAVDLDAWARRWKAVDPPPRLVAYGSHVDAEGMGRAAAAGFDEVMPNSRFHRTLPELLRQ